MRLIENQTNEQPFSSWIILILAVACGLIAANLYYAQPIFWPISSALDLSSGANGFIVTLTQIGYGLGLLFIVPLGDILENRKLVTVSLLLTASVLVFAGLAKSAALFLVVSLLIGLGSVGDQILLPYAAHLSPEATRGRQVGNVMSGCCSGSCSPSRFKHRDGVFGLARRLLLIRRIDFCIGPCAGIGASRKKAHESDTVPRASRIDVAVA